jgi:hypothetical protein
MTMLQRLAIAFAGACVITVVLFYGMSAIAEYFNRPDSQVYMRVMDFIPGSGARRLPDKRMPEAQPERARIEQPVEATQESAAVPAFEDASRVQIEINVDLPPPESTQPP